MWVSPLRAKALTPHTHVGKNEATPHIEREIARDHGGRVASSSRPINPTKRAETWNAGLSL